MPPKLLKKMKQHTKKQKKMSLLHKKNMMMPLPLFQKSIKVNLLQDVQKAIDELEIATLLADEFNTIVDNAAKTTETLLAEMNQAKADWDAAVANIETAEQKKEEAIAALENSAYATLIKEAKELSSQIECTNRLLEFLTS